MAPGRSRARSISTIEASADLEPIHCPAPVRPAADGVEGVVDQVAHDGGDVGGVTRRRGGQRGPRRDAQVDTELGRLARLGDEQRRDRGVRDRGGPPSRTSRLAELARHERAPPRTSPELDEPGDGVQPVAELVRLGPQRVGACRVGQLPARAPAARCGRAASSPSRSAAPGWRRQPVDRRAPRPRWRRRGRAPRRR